jgi:hypothetical protein
MAQEQRAMREPERVPVEEAVGKVRTGEVPLVCAYEDESRCRRMRLEGAMTLGEFTSILPEFPKDREIIFYCA